MSYNPDGFLTRDASYCRLNVSSANFVNFYTCHKPVSGRYLTIRQLEHWEYDRSKSITEKFCVDLCEVYIYVDSMCSDIIGHVDFMSLFFLGRNDMCGEQLVTNKVIPESQVILSSSDAEPHGALLYGSPAWCADDSDSDPFIMVYE